MRIVLPLLFGCAVATAQAALPVTVDADFTASTNQAVNIVQYVKQVAMLEQQYQQLQQTYNTLNGLRNTGNLLNNNLLAQYLPADYQRALAALKSGQGGSLSGISGSLNQIAASNQAQSCSASYSDPAAVAKCNQVWQTLAMNKYVGQAGYAQSAANIAQLQQFVGAITTTSDPKALQDLQARIHLQAIKQQEEATKLNTIAMMQKADEDMTRARNAQSTQQAITAPMNMRWGANAGNN